MRTILERITAGNYGLFHEGDGGDGGAGDGGAGGDGGGDGGAKLPPKDGAGDGGAKLPPKGDGGDGGGDIVSYDFEKDTAGLNTIDLKGEQIGGKFKSVGDLHKSYTELEQSYGKKSEDLAKELGFFTPDAYEFGDMGKDWDTDTNAAVTEAYKAIGLSQAQAEKATPEIMKISQELATSLGKQELMDAWNLTGEAYKAKENQVAAWAQANIPETIYSSLEQLGAEGMLVAESMMRSNTERPLWTGKDSGVDLNDIQDQIVAVETAMKAQEPGSQEYKANEKRRTALYQKKNPPKA